MGNGHTERFNRTLGNMIGVKQRWPQMLTFAYNCTAHESTGYALFSLMYGPIPRLPVDVVFHNVERDNDITYYNGYAKRMRDDFKEALALAQVNANSSQQCQADLYNRETKGTDIEEGDQVLLANRCGHGHRKLADSPYTAVSKDSMCHTYCIRQHSTGQEKVVHRNLLLQANFLPVKLDHEIESCFDSGSEPS